jgi:hypothetical protein
MKMQGLSYFMFQRVYFLLSANISPRPATAKPYHPATTALENSLAPCGINKHYQNKPQHEEATHCDA